MKKLILAILLFLTMSFAMAEVNTRGLTTAQEAELTIQAEKMKEQGSAPSAEVQKVASNVEVVSKWAEAGKSLAVGLGAGAREVGVAVNEFADTKVGRITTVIIIWKLMGKELLGLTLGLTIIFILIPIVWRTSRFLMAGAIEYEDRQFLWFTVRRKKKLSLVIDDDNVVILMATIAASIVMFFLAMHLLPY